MHWLEVSFRVIDVAVVLTARAFFFLFFVVVRPCRSGSAMSLTDLRMWVGLTPNDAASLFAHGAEVEPHWGGRWGLKPTASEARVRILTTMTLVDVIAFSVVSRSVTAGHSPCAPKRCAWREREGVGSARSGVYSGWRLEFGGILTWVCRLLFECEVFFFLIFFTGSELVFAVLSGCWQALAVREFPRVFPTLREAQAGEGGRGWDSLLHGELGGLEDPVSVDYGVTYRGRCFVGERCAVGSVRARRLHARRLTSFVSSFHAGRGTVCGWICPCTPSPCTPSDFFRQLISCGPCFRRHRVL